MCQGTLGPNRPNRPIARGYAWHTPNRILGFLPYHSMGWDRGLGSHTIRGRYRISLVSFHGMVYPWDLSVGWNISGISHTS